MAHRRVGAVSRVAALAILCLTSLSAAPGSAAPLDAELQSQLMQLYDRYNREVAVGKVDEVVALRSSETRKAMKPYLGSASKRRELLKILGEGIPDTLEVKHASLAKDGTSAVILLLAKKRGAAAELTLNFVKEAGQWRFGDQIFGMDPAEIVACKDVFEPVEAYDSDRNVEVGGPIVRVAYEADYTLLVVRVLDQQNCAYMPNRAAIEKAGLNLDLLVPYAIAEISGLPHKTDGQKVWVDHITVRAE
jgi:hypothetical protein